MNNIYLVDDNSNKELRSLLEGLDFINIVSDDLHADSYIKIVKQRLFIVDQEIGELDLLSTYAEIIKRKSQIKEELLVKSLGDNYSGASVLDLTGGLGRDSLIFALAGLNVTIIEYNPLLAVALCYMRYLLRSLAVTIDVINQDSQQFMINQKLMLNNKYKYVYLDPMFEQSKDAKSKKPMQIIARVAKYDNPINLFEIVYSNLASGTKLIVKRDNKQQEITTSVKPNYIKSGKTVRYDIYLK